SPAPTSSAHESNSAGNSDAVDVEMEGTLEVLHEDEVDGRGQYRHFVSTRGGKRWSVDGVQHGHDLLTGDRVKIQGRLSGNTIRIRPSTTPSPTSLAYGATGQTAGTTGGLQVLAAAPVANTFDVHK